MFIINNIDPYCNMIHIYSSQHQNNIISGLQVLPQSTTDSPNDRNKPAFSFDNDTSMNLDGPGYALSLLLIGKLNLNIKIIIYPSFSGEILILGMAFFWGGLGFGGRSFSTSQVPQFAKRLNKLFTVFQYSEEIPMAVVDLSQSLEEVGHAVNCLVGLMDPQHQIVEQYDEIRFIALELI